MTTIFFVGAIVFFLGRLLSHPWFDYYDPDDYVDGDLGDSDTETRVDKS